MSLPYAIDAEQPLTASELDVLRGQYERELNQGHASTQTKFNYAWGLVKSKRREDMALGVDLLTGVCPGSSLPGNNEGSSEVF